MRIYEELFILRIGLPEEEVAAVIAQITGVITTGGGTIEKNDNWGVRKLAYRVKKQVEGIYVLIQFTSGPSIVKEIERRLRVNRVQGDNLDPQLAKDIAIEAARGWTGLGVSDGARISIAGRDMATGRLGAADGTRALLSDPSVEALLQITTAEEISANGLGCDRICLAILAPPVPDAAAAHLIAAISQTVVMADNDHSFPDACSAAIRDVAAAAHEG